MAQTTSWLDSQTRDVHFPLHPSYQEQWSAWDFTVDSHTHDTILYFRVSFGNKDEGYSTCGVQGPYDALDRIVELIQAGTLLEMHDDFTFPTIEETESNFR